MLVHSRVFGAPYLWNFASDCKCCTEVGNIASVNPGLAFTEESA